MKCAISIFYAIIVTISLSFVNSVAFGDTKKRQASNNKFFEKRSIFTKQKTQEKLRERSKIIRYQTLLSKETNVGYQILLTDWEKEQ